MTTPVAGRWSQPYRDAGYRVIQVDPKLPYDPDKGLLNLTAESLLMSLQHDPNWYRYIGNVRGILSAPVCTHFSVSGAQYWPEKDLDGRTAKSLELVDAVLGIVSILKPAWWVLENPKGRLNTLRPQLEQFGPRYFDPYEYAGYLRHLPEWSLLPNIRERAKTEKLKRAEVQAIINCNVYTKQTGLWGVFNWMQHDSVEPIRCCDQGSWTQILGGKSEKTKELRSMTPSGFAKAFFLANP